jgi:hypothetical protein
MIYVARDKYWCCNYYFFMSRGGCCMKYDINVAMEIFYSQIGHQSYLYVYIYLFYVASVDFDVAIIIYYL